MPRKKRSLEEVEDILRSFANGLSISDISKKYQISEASFYRILRVSRGEPADASQRKRVATIEKLEKTLREREKEISLLRAALKKS